MKNTNYEVLHYVIFSNLPNILLSTFLKQPQSVILLG